MAGARRAPSERAEVASVEVICMILLPLAIALCLYALGLFLWRNQVRPPASVPSPCPCSRPSPAAVRPPPRPLRRESLCLSPCGPQRARTRCLPLPRLAFLVPHAPDRGESVLCAREHASWLCRSDAPALLHAPPCPGPTPSTPPSLHMLVQCDAPRRCVRVARIAGGGGLHIYMWSARAPPPRSLSALTHVSLAPVRAQVIKIGLSSPIDDRRGPLALAACVVLALSAIFLLSIKDLADTMAEQVRAGCFAPAPITPLSHVARREIDPSVTAGAFSLLLVALCCPS